MAKDREGNYFDPNFKPEIKPSTIEIKAGDLDVYSTTAEEFGGVEISDVQIRGGLAVIEIKANSGSFVEFRQEVEKRLMDKIKVEFIPEDKLEEYRRLARKHNIEVTVLLGGKNKGNYSEDLVVPSGMTAVKFIGDEENLREFRHELAVNNHKSN